ncbi:MAG: hypothetical protein FD153_1044 [Rhodospirillaceae bacterium]|nr:MAG: hypothetical protein FD153_1044 [Rhodospirillaceae bacterium]
MSFAYLFRQRRRVIFTRLSRILCGKRFQQDVVDAGMGGLGGQPPLLADSHQQKEGMLIGFDLARTQGIR